jgi:hypothetical protein
MPPPWSGRYDAAIEACLPLLRELGLTRHGTLAEHDIGIGKADARLQRERRPADMLSRRPGDDDGE